jgi:hypothetical protein
MGGPDGLLERLWRTSLLLLGTAIALYVAVQLIQAVWHILLAIAAALGAAWLILALLRYRRSGW